MHGHVVSGAWEARSNRRRRWQCSSAGEAVTTCERIRGTPIHRRTVLALPRSCPSIRRRLCAIVKVITCDSLEDQSWMRTRHTVLQKWQHGPLGVVLAVACLPNPSTKKGDHWKCKTGNLLYDMINWKILTQRVPLCAINTIQYTDAQRWVVIITTLEF